MEELYKGLWVSILLNIDRVYKKNFVRAEGKAIRYYLQQLLSIIKLHFQFTPVN